jgi:hypothetical protein
MQSEVVGSLERSNTHSWIDKHTNRSTYEYETSSAPLAISPTSPTADTTHPRDPFEDRHAYRLSNAMVGRKKARHPLFFLSRKQL